MPVPSAISDLSTTPASNSPAGSETPSFIDDYLRTAFAFIRQTSDTATAALPKAGGVLTGDLTLPSLNGGQLAGHRNKLINGDFSQNARALTSVADDSYCLDRWYVLTETGNVTVGKLGDPESGAPWGIRLTQPDATAKRIGFAQIIESRDIRQYASTAMNLSARLRLSTAANIRYAVIEHTGTGNVVTSDVVNDWASATFTPSNFFIAGVNIISTGTIAPGAATWGSVSDWDALGADVRNVIVFIWTESQVAQDVTLDCSRIQYEPGEVATPHEWRINELQLCQRYYCETRGSVTFTAAAANNSAACSIFWPVEMRDTPATTNAGGSITNASSAVVDGISKYGARYAIVATAAGGCSVANRVITASAEL